MESLPSSSWWIDPSIQWSYPAFSAAVERELPRMVEHAGKWTWPIDQPRCQGKPLPVRVLIRQ